jgi:hypothetical protein
MREIVSKIHSNISFINNVIPIVGTNIKKNGSIVQ